jgi:hypothetical protein
VELSVLHFDESGLWGTTDGGLVYEREFEYANNLGGESVFDTSFDPVSKPSHYNTDGIECIDYIKQVLGTEGFIAYCRGNFMKYNHRAFYKGKPKEDFAKAEQYLKWVNETLDEQFKSENTDDN